MHPLELFLVVLVTTGAASAVYSHPAAAGTPAARFWEEALPGTPMPEAIADLIQQGIDHSPLVEHFTSSGHTPVMNINYGYGAYAGSSLMNAAVPPGSFFLQSQLRVGTAMTVSSESAATVPPILPRDVAQKACTTSLEDTVESATHMLVVGSSVRHGVVYLWAASSAAAVPPAAHHHQQQYVVQAVTSLDGDRHVGCHAMPFPYAVYYCHMTGRPSKAYAVLLRSVTGGSSAPVTKAAICHLDTSNWDPAHPAFEMLHTRPGGEPVCHFMSYASLLFGEKAAN
ncbi:hypothetical protein BDA96_08G174100 [Sorghum bicolor]|uniref:BURP domain-containing protein n=2 Tax=Sorghum bicolor TaxID=4558 RepID=A0A921QGS6_SORBI|nr:hypothetical protein BDA96_08G174100 [Sorghum bicolor]KXG23909.1 hypothetical protein SORBI_3008G157600 [Sorghum bicolor]